MAVFLIIVLTVLSGLMAMAETALVSSHKVRLKQRAEGGGSAARAAYEMVERPTPMLTATQLGITLFAILSGALGEASLSESFEQYLLTKEAFARYADEVSLVAVVAGITLFSVLVGEILPKRVALIAPEAISTATSLPLIWFIRLTAPFIAVISWMTDILLIPFLRFAPKSGAVTSEEINIMLEEGARTGEFGPEERRLIERVLHLGDQRIDALMIHRTEMAWLDIATPIEKARRMARASLLSHFPVCKGNVDRIVGVVGLRDLMPGEGPGPTDLKSIAHPPVFVPESAPALRVLDRCRQAQAPVAFVVDEYGAVQGEVTVERILDRLVGRVWSGAGGGAGGQAAGGT